MKKIRKAAPLLLSFLLWMVYFPVMSQDLAEYLNMAAQNNPGLKSRYNEYRASLERIPQAGGLPDPQLTVGYFIEPMEKYMGDQVAEMSVMQMFPWFGTLGAAKDEAALMAKANYESYNEAKSMLHYEVKATWYKLFMLEEEVNITKENIRILQMLENIAIGRVRSGGISNIKSSVQQRTAEPMPGGGTDASGYMGGMGSIQGQNMGSTANRNRSSGMESMQEMSSSGSMVDVLRTQIELIELNDRLLLLMDSRKTIIARFNQLLNRPLTDSVIIPDTMIALHPPLPLEEIPDSIIENHPFLKMLQSKEDAYVAQAKMNRKMGFPMIGVGLQYQIFNPRNGNETMMNGKNMLMPMASVSIPIWRKKYNAAVKESEWMRQMTADQRQNSANELLVDYEEALHKLHDAERRVELLEKQSALAQQALNILTVQYSTDGSNFEELLRMQQQLYDYRLKSFNAIVDQNTVVARLEQLLGR